MFLISTELKAQLTLSVSPSSQCAYSFGNTAWGWAGVTNTVAGTTSYSWTVSNGGACTPTFAVINGGKNLNNIFFPCPAVYTVVCTAYNGASVIGTSVMTMTVLPTPTVSVINTGSICSGSSATLSYVGSPGVYTWNPGGSTATSIVVSPTTTTIYTVSTQGSNGCYGHGQTTVDVINSTPNILVSGVASGIVCAGLYHFVASGAGVGGTYTWQPSGTIANTININLTPGNTCFTVGGSNSCGWGTATRCFTVLANPTLAVAGNGTFCAGSSLTLTASGANTYSWGAPYNSTNNPIVVTPAANQTVNLGGFSGGCYSNMLVSITGMQGSVINITGPSNVCPGSAVTLSASGASNYTWTDGSTTTPNTPTITFNASSGTCYTVTSTSTGTSGCPTVSGIKCVNVTSTLTASIGGNATVCAGSGWQSSIWANVNGGGTYTWSPGNYTSYYLPVLPSTNTCYTLNAKSAGGCTASATKCFTVVTLPPLSVSGNTSFCAGTAGSFTASGGTGTYSWTSWSPALNTTGTVVAISPTISSSSFTMHTYNAATGCHGYVTTYLNILPMPSLSLTPVSQTVCKGSSVNFVVSGGVTYTWSHGPTTSNVNILPTSSQNYTVWGTGSNGCEGFKLASVAVNTACSDVWPGDANSDGIVDNTDVFEIGLAYNNTGAPRVPASITYFSHHATNWAGLVSSGKNQCHADCNGDGTVNNGDTLAIFNNFSLTHAFKSSGSSSSDDIQIDKSKVYADVGMWNKVDIYASSQMTSLYGVCFDLDFDYTLIEPNAAYLVYTSSFLNASDQNVDFKKMIFSNGKLYTATVRTDKSTVNGSGKLAEFWFKVKEGITEGTDLHIGITNAKKTDKISNSNLTSSGTVLKVTANVTGLGEATALANQVRMYPNPTAGKLTLQSAVTTQVNYVICDISGREVVSGAFTGSKNIDLSNLASGAYVVRLESGSVNVYKKLVIEK